ncbi:hypothetical protein SNK03_007619 [Fusarium graminearum]|uniref:Chromosome 2, complete genome n=1 Tax=Gibberella zeae (strain ATCC MYA-4620 / CBS 123657 / FGSC 9075 / NRRL 31084 / PH-1) TaxID=229533 RepID=I1S403_GIBZE|nr:hypothetical protein FGSG_11555 [Fusarium graminearum PH-1]ESU08325.1 hypothetical protein FGSG_11555 [Fusarium graminearum PH-1]CEF79779.1 unnamed protein product [Fusarium graminearum]|eukprot:XP_011323071.1 hypothetical protein FGSG_11555 [Fusarium graminearum PH-1]
MCDFSEYGPKSAEWLAVEASLLPPPAFTDIYERQAVINKGREEISANEMKELGHLVCMKDHKIPTRDNSLIEARCYRPIDAADDVRLPIYIHLHGGGYLFGTLSSEDAISSRIAIGAKVTVINVNYRHTPEHTFPTAWNDVEDAFYWVHDHIEELQGKPKQVVIGGISAGAQLAAALALRQNISASDIRQYPKIAGQILMIPALVHKDYNQSQIDQLKSPLVSSYVQNEDAPILPKKVIDFFTGMLKFPFFSPDAEDFRANTGNASASQVEGLPPTVFGIAGADPLRDEGLLYGKKLAEAGVPTDIHVFKGLPHGFRRYGDQLTESKRWDKVMEEGITWALSNPEARNFEVKST